MAEFVELLKRSYRLSQVSEAGHAYLCAEFYKYILIIFPSAIITIFVFAVLEVGQQSNLASIVWLVPMLILQALRYLFTKAALNDINNELTTIYFHVIDSLASCWWVAYLFIMGLGDTSEEGFIRRFLLLFILITFYVMSALRYKKLSFVLQSCIFCFGMILYLLVFTHFDSDFKVQYGLLCVYGLSAVLLFGAMGHVLACRSYWLFHENQQLLEEKHVLFIHDELTGIHNRRFFKSQLARHIALFNRYQQTFCLAMLEIDGYQNIHDIYGQDVCDDVLESVSSLIAKQLRQTDIFSRYDESQFMLIFPNEADEAIVGRLEQIKESVANHEIQYLSQQIPVTLSVGVTQITTGDDKAYLMQRVQHALNRAKKAGRNTVQCI